MRLLDYRNFPRSGEWTDDVATCMTPTVQSGGEGGGERATRSIEQALLEQPTILLSAFPMVDKRQWDVGVRDWWLWLVGLVASVVSVGATWYYYQTHKILLYSDALSHMRLARSVFDSMTPGLAQLGDVWLPLPHILMWPFVWNTTLWQTGLAGSIPSMTCYFIASIYLFLTIRHLTKNSLVSFIGTLIFILNPNILYLQVTPLSELLCIATFTSASYYFLLWVENDRTKFLLYSTCCTFLATLSRYDGWALFLALLTLIVLVGWIKSHSWRQIVAHVVLFIPLGSLGILLWFLWSAIIFGSPLYFQSGPFSAETQQRTFLHRNQLYTYHNIGESIRTYFLLSLQTLGSVLFILGVIACLFYLITHLLRFRKGKDRIQIAVTLAVLAFLAPYAFYAVSLYTGQAIIWTPGAVPSNAPSQFFNVRYGAQTIVPAAIFLSLVVNMFVLRFKNYLVVSCYMLFIFLIIAQSLLINRSGIISLQDGISGIDCIPILSSDLYLAQHYDGKRILVDTFNSNVNEAEDGIDLRNVIYDGSGSLWHIALQNPASLVDWVIADPGDLVSQHLNVHSLAFTEQFALVVNSPGSYLYHRMRVPVPTRPIPQNIRIENTACRQQ